METTAQTQLGSIASSALPTAAFAVSPSLCENPPALEALA